MGTVALLFGLLIFIRPNDHNPPHIHVWYGNDEAKFSIVDGSIISGSIPSTKVRIVEDFISCYREELLEMWNTQSYRLLKKK